MSSIRDGLRVIALEKHVDELRTLVDMLSVRIDALVKKQEELEEAWREAAKPRNGPPSVANDARKTQGRPFDVR